MSLNAFTNRYEIKYLVEMSRLAEIKAALSDFFRPDKHSAEGAGYYVCSVYYDSPLHRFYSEKREGQLLRIKPRIRTYLAAPDAVPDTFFLELKGRQDRIVLKRREQISREMATNLLRASPGSLDARDIESPTLAEFLYLTERFGLAPCVTVMYRREPFDAAFYPRLRLTFDTRLQCSFRTGLDNPPHAYLDAIPSTYCVMELKYNDRIPRLFLDRIRRLQLKQQSISKFAISVERCFESVLPGRYAS